jgi:lysophospholipase L1-like esterase
MTNLQTPEQLAYRLQFAHVEKGLAAWPGASDEAVLASIFGIPLEEFRRIRQSFTDRAAQAARELLAGAEFSAAFDQLPFAKGAVVAGLGDSITDDWQSWFEILRHALAIRRPHDSITLVNAGLSGDTTSQMISRFIGILEPKPDWIFCFAGTNDARLHGHRPIKTLVSIEETERNLRALRNFAATQAPMANWVWMTPATVQEDVIASHWFLGRQNQLGWRNSDLAAIAHAMKRMGDPAVDLQAVFGTPPKAGYLLEDGLHPDIEGQKAILRALVVSLASNRT